MSNLRVVESMSGTWYYHLADALPNKSLCGVQVMHTALPLESWGTVTHLQERYCAKCAEGARLLGLEPFNTKGA